MELINTIMTLWSAMDDDEKRLLVLKLGKAAIDDGLVDEEVVSFTKDVGKSAPEPKRRKISKPFWIKRVDGIDNSKKGMFQVEGGWVNDVSTDVCEGGLVIVGTKEPRHYYLARAIDKERLVVDVGGNDMSINGLSRVTDANSFAGVKAEVQKHLPL